MEELLERYYKRPNIIIRFKQELTKEQVMYLYDFHGIFTSYAWKNDPNPRWLRSINDYLETREHAYRYFG